MPPLKVAAAEAERSRAEVTSLRAALDGYRRGAELASSAHEKYAQELRESREKVAGWATQMQAWREAADAWQSEARAASEGAAVADSARDDACERAASAERRAAAAEQLARREAAAAAVARQDAAAARGEAAAAAEAAERARQEAASGAARGDTALQGRVRELSELCEGLNSRVPQQDQRIAELVSSLAQLECDAATAAAAAHEQQQRDAARCDVLATRVEQLKNELEKARLAATRAVAEVGAGGDVGADGVDGEDKAAVAAQEPLSVCEAVARLAEAAYSGKAAVAAAASAAAAAESASTVADATSKRAERLDARAESQNVETRALRSRLVTAEASLEEMQSSVQSLHAIFSKVVTAASAMVETERAEPVGLAQALREQLSDVRKAGRCNEARIEALEASSRENHRCVQQLEAEIGEALTTAELVATATADLVENASPKRAQGGR